jgi:flagellar hook-basal body complex protein FliE
MNPLSSIALTPATPGVPRLPAIHTAGSGSLAAVDLAGEVNGPGGPTANGFGQLLRSGLQQVNQLQTDANAASIELLTGGPVTSAEVFTAVQKADLALRTMIQIRNKLLQAYQELMAMQV